MDKGKKLFSSYVGQLSLCFIGYFLVHGLNAVSFRIANNFIPRYAYIPLFS